MLEQRFRETLQELNQRVVSIFLGEVLIVLKFVEGIHSDQDSLGHLRECLISQVLVRDQNEQAPRIDQFLPRAQVTCA